MSDGGQQSELHEQLSGISQGCTLSPLLFIVAMTVLVFDAVGMLSPEAREAYHAGDLAELIYADDTLLLGVSMKHVETYLQAVFMAGHRYGMELHWGKFQLVTTNAEGAVIRTADGAEIVSKTSMEYLGTLLCGDGGSDYEVNRRIALARADFECLAKVWTHSCLTWKRKLHIFTAIVESKLLFAMSGLCLTVALERRLNGFQNRCVRRIIGVKPAFISRVSNVEVLEKAGHRQLTTTLRKRRLQLFGRVLRSPEGHLLRVVSLIPRTLEPATNRYVRRVGRPCREWVPEAIRDCRSIFGSMQNAQVLAIDKQIWNAELYKHFCF